MKSSNAAKHRYSIHGHIAKAGYDAFTVRVVATPLNEGAPPIDQHETCDPCTYEEVRATCYKFIARIAQAIGAAGGDVVDVIVTDDRLW